MEKGRYLEKIIVNIEEPKDFLIRTLAYGYRNRLEVDPINKKNCELWKYEKKDGDTSYNYILSRLKKRFDFKLDIEYMKTNYAFFLEALIEIVSNEIQRKYIHMNEKESTNRTHDVTNIIYGTYADVLITSDIKLHKQAKLIYDLLGVKTEVILENLNNKDKN